MKVEVWNSFTANNSGSHYVVGRFGNATTAQGVATELSAFLTALEAELEVMPQHERYSRESPTTLGREFFDARGLAWTENLVRGEGEDEELEVLAAGEQVLIYHHYCLGMGDGVGDYIRALGGVVERENMWSVPSVSLLTECSSLELFEQLRAMFKREHEPEISFFDGRWAGLVASFDPTGLTELKLTLERMGVSRFHLSLDNNVLAHRFPAMKDGRCSACRSVGLRYLPGFAYGTATDQIGCPACDGMFEVSEFFSTSVLYLRPLESRVPEVLRQCFDPLVRDSYTVGRGRGANLEFLGRGGIARRHLIITYEEEAFVLTDLKPTNRTKINGVEVERGHSAALADGDVVELPNDVSLRVSIVRRS